LNNLLFNSTFFEKPEDLSGKSAWVGHIPFAIWLIDFLKPATVVELGTHCGDSYFAFCQSAKKFSVNTRLFAVDTWQGDKHAGFYESDIYKRVNRINEHKYKDNSVLIKKTFKDALVLFSDKSIDLLHIDGFHTYEAVKNDFESWLPKLSSYSVVLFHDTIVQRDDFGVYQLWNELKAKFPSLNFKHSNGLGMLITGSQENQKLKVLCDLVKSEEFSDLFINYFKELGETYENLQKINTVDNVIEFSKHLEKDVAELKMYSQKLEKDVAELKMYSQKLEKDVAELKTYSQKLEKDAVEQNTHAQILEKDKSELELTVKLNRRKLDDTEKELIRLKDEINRIYSTKSWRYTILLRQIRRFSLVNLYSRLETALRGNPLGRFIFRLKIYKDRLETKIDELSCSRANYVVIDTMAKKRSDILFSKGHIAQKSRIKKEFEIDLTAVIYNNSHWLDKYIASLVRQKYPSSKINIFFVNNGSTDHSLEVLYSLKEKYKNVFNRFEIIENKNIGFGAGHDSAVKSGKAEFILISNIDMEFVEDAIANVVNYAISDQEKVASWEFRQRPYEHPKYYDPVTFETTWSSHACILVRRSAYEKVGGYDKRIFMYGEDVELSYRFRDAGYSIKYIPSAVVNHYTYEEANQIKPVQFTGSALANALIRFRYGSIYDKMMVFPLQFLIICKGAGFKGSRMLALKNQFRILKNIPTFWRNRKENSAFPFRGFDYEMTRHGSFYNPRTIPGKTPLVSILTRTCTGREALLRECIVSVMNQTYSNIEHVIVEDGGDSMASLITEVRTLYPDSRITYKNLPKNGRCYAGNQSMENAKGEYFLILDDDDLLFADHIETLVGELVNDENLDGVYSLAWEVETSFSHDGKYQEHSHKTEDLFFQEFDRDLLMRHNYIPIQSILFKRELYEKYGGFDLEMEVLEDWNLWSRYALNAKFKFIEKTTSLYRTPHDLDIRIKRRKILDLAYPDAIERQKRAIAEYGNNDESVKN
jgi:GT2 family glycosyltransferase